MDINQITAKIKHLITASSGKDVDVHFTFRGSGYGQSNPWIAKCDNKEGIGKTIEDAAMDILNKIEKDLLERIKLTEIQLQQYKSAIGNSSTLEN